MKVTILGAEYEITETTQKENGILENADGFCSNYDKYILVEKEPFANDKYANENEKTERKKLIKRHELVHAFITESGALNTVLDNEFCVHWIAMQFSKMLAAFREVEAI